MSDGAGASPRRRASGVRLAKKASGGTTRPRRLTKAHLDKVPSGWRRRQTLTGAERYVDDGGKARVRWILCVQIRQRGLPGFAFVFRDADVLPAAEFARVAPEKTDEPIGALDDDGLDRVIHEKARLGRAGDGCRHRHQHRAPGGIAGRSGLRRRSERVGRSADPRAQSLRAAGARGR